MFFKVQPIGKRGGLGLLSPLGVRSKDGYKGLSTPPAPFCNAGISPRPLVHRLCPRVKHFSQAVTVCRSRIPAFDCIGGLYPPRALLGIRYDDIARSTRGGGLVRLRLRYSVVIRLLLSRFTPYPLRLGILGWGSSCLYHTIRYPISQDIS